MRVVLRLAGPVLALALIALAQACGGGNTVIWGATTSVQDTGLLDALVAAFEDETGYHVTPVVGGSGQILEQARRGELDVVMTHSPKDEAVFIDEGFGLEPSPVMQNYFMIAGPPDDPVGVAQTSSLRDAFAAIAAAEATFVSRGDDSGTHKRELSIWKDLGINPAGKRWYQESAVGQGQNLLVASDKAAYTLVDTSTFITLRDRVQLVAFVTDTTSPNVYTVMLINPEKFPRVNINGARALAGFLTGVDGQAVIAAFGRAEFGEALFQPAGAVHGAP